jgi:uncharacterized protein YndB with AHSA1/START domain
MARRRTRTLRNQYFVRASPKKVFRAITEPKRLTRWLCDTAELSPRKGGRFSLGWTDGPTHQGKLLEFVRGRSVTFGWTWPGLDEVPVTRFKLSVEPKGKGTLLRVTHAGIPSGEKWTDLYAGAVWGWTYFAMNLKSVLETGEDLRSRFDG